MLTAVYFEDDSGVMGFVEELLAVSAWSPTLEETREKLEEGARLFLQAHRSESVLRLKSYSEVRREKFTVRLDHVDRF